MRFKVETITPERARQMMTRTETLGQLNRGLRRRRVEKIAHAILTGQWMVTPQGISLSPQGAVLDGQHRLEGISLAGEAVDMVVVYDVDPATFGVLDTGAPRTTGDTLKVAGYADTNILAAAIRGYLVYAGLMGHAERNYRTSMVNLTSLDVLEFLEDPDTNQAAMAGVTLGRRVSKGLGRHGLTTPVAMSHMAIALHPNDLGDTTVAEFYERLTDGASLAPDSPILALRRWFMLDNGYAKVSNEARRAVATANILKGVNDYALRRPRTVYAFKLGTEAFPAPLPPGALKARELELEKQERGEK